MPTEEPGATVAREAAPDPGRDTTSVTFRPDLERADGTPSDTPEPLMAGAAPSAATAPAATAPARRRRFLDDPDPDAPKAPRQPKEPKSRRVRARKVRRIVRHVEPWSVLKVSVLFFASLFLIICVASAVLWQAGRSAGVIDDVESFITSLGFGNCEDIPGQASTPSTTTTAAPAGGAVDQLDPDTGSSSTATTEPPVASTLPDEDGECAEGQRLVGGFKFEDQRIFQAFALGGVVMVLAGAAGSVVLALLFNLISDLTGGVRVTVLEEEPAPRSHVASGSQPRRRAD